MLRRTVILGSLLGLIISLWPPATTLYDLTGEENLSGQAVGLTHWLLTAIRPQPQLAPDAPINHVDVPITGMNTFLQGEVEEAKREETLRLLNEAGFGFIRQEFTWEDIEIHAKGDFTDRRNEGTIGIVDAWVKYDNIVDLANQYDIEVIARLSNPPSWSRALTNTIGTLAPPDNITDYGDFVEAIVQRYDGKVRYYQLWNEPNIYPEWGEQPVSPEDFTALLCEGYQRAKQVNPDVVVLSPALAQTQGTPDRRNLNDLVFLARMYEAGAKECFDVLSAQAYGLFSGPTNHRLSPSRINIQRMLYHRDLMVRYGDKQKPVWVSEAGWNSVPEDWEGFAQYGRVDEETKGTYALELFERVADEWSWVGVVNLWYLKKPAPETDLSYHFRLMEPDFTPLDSWLILQSNLSESRQAPTGDDVWPSRPPLFIISVAILFFLLLQTLASQKSTMEP